MREPGGLIWVHFYFYIKVNKIKILLTLGEWPARKGDQMDEPKTKRNKQSKTARADSGTPEGLIGSNTAGKADQNAEPNAAARPESSVHAGAKFAGPTAVMARTGSDYRQDAPEIIREFLTYLEVIRGNSRKTVNEYFLDLRTFFRYIKILRGRAPKQAAFSEIPISDVDLDLVSSITLSDVYAYLSYLSRDRMKNPRGTAPTRGVGAAARARKVASIRSFYKYLTTKVKLLRENPVADLDAPKQRKDLPRYLTEQESLALLSSISGPNKERDYCILTLFLNCGLRISELVGLNLSGIQADSIRVLGKGNKVRVLYLNDACAAAINAYLPVRKHSASSDRDAFFVTSRRERISTAAVHKLVKKYIGQAGLDAGRYSSHKLRHTAATLMLQNGVDVRTLQEILGHENLNTTQIYTHVDNENLRTAVRANPLSKVKPK